MANFGVSPVEARDALVKNGITINGLAILSEEPWLDDNYYRSNVVGGPDAFVLVAKSFDSFAEAIPRKLVQEVASGSDDNAVHTPRSGKQDISDLEISRRQPPFIKPPLAAVPQLGTLAQDHLGNVERFLRMTLLDAPREAVLEIRLVREFREMDGK